MTDQNYTHITIVADRSGSMQSIRTDAEGAINSFVAEQAKVEGRATLTLIDFDSTEPHRVVYRGAIGDAPPYVLTPRGMTPLRDAIGKAIVDTGERLAALDEEYRPGHVFFVIQTDGQENASHEWTQEAINALIKSQEDDFAWTFIFLATGPDAWSTAQAYAGTQMLRTNTVKNTGAGHSHDVSVGYVGQNIAATRSGGQTMSYGVDVDDAGTVTERTEATK